MNFLRKHPFYSLLILLVIILIVTSIVGSQRIDRAPETTTGEEGYVRPLWQD